MNQPEIINRERARVLLEFEHANYRQDKRLARWCCEHQRWCSDHSAIELDVWVWFEQLREEMVKMADGSVVLPIPQTNKTAA
jgi:hypothetical protein